MKDFKDLSREDLLLIIEIQENSIKEMTKILDNIT